MPVPLLPWFLAAAAGLAWAANASGKTTSKPGSRPTELVPLEPLEPILRPPSGGVPIAQPVPMPQMPDFSGRVSTMPVGGGTPVIVVNAPPPGAVPIAPPANPVPMPKLTPVPSAPTFDTLPIRSPGLTGSLPSTPKQPQPIKVVPTPPPNAVPISPPTKVITVPAPPPGAVPIAPPKNPVVSHKNPRDALAAEAYKMLKQSEPSQTVKDPVLLSSYQAQEGLDPSTRGKFGPGTGKSFIKYGFVPPKPFWWGKSVQTNKDDWRKNMLTMARQDPQRRDEWEFASQV